MSEPGIDADADVQAEGLRACRQILEGGDCRSIRYFSQIDSTNSAACRDLTAAASCDASSLPRLYLADAQTAGRGRLGRKWLADKGTLTFSMMYRVGGDQALTLDTQTTSLVALATGVAIARAIEYLAAPVSARIKWPNDVHVAGGKVAGVLVESVASRSDCMVIGVGLNVATGLEPFADSMTAPARSLSQIARGSNERYDWLAEIVAQMRQAYQQLGGEPQRLLDELRCRCLLSGTEVRYQSGDAVKRARCLGIDNQGSLLVQSDGKIDSIRSGEVWQVRTL